MGRAARALRREREVGPRRTPCCVECGCHRSVPQPIGYPGTTWRDQEVAADEDEHLVFGALAPRDRARITRAVVGPGRRVAAVIIAACAGCRDLPRLAGRRSAV